MRLSSLRAWPLQRIRTGSTPEFTTDLAEFLSQRPRQANVARSSYF